MSLMPGSQHRIDVAILAETRPEFPLVVVK